MKFFDNQEKINKNKYITLKTQDLSSYQNNTDVLDFYKDIEKYNDLLEKNMLINLQFKKS